MWAFCSFSYLLIHISLVSFSAETSSFRFWILSSNCFLWISLCLSRDRFFISSMSFWRSTSPSRFWSFSISFLCFSSWYSLSFIASPSCPSSLILSFSCSSFSFRTLLDTFSLSETLSKSPFNYVNSSVKCSWLIRNDVCSLSSTSKFLLTVSCSSRNFSILSSRSFLISWIPTNCFRYSCISMNTSSCCRCNRSHFSRYYSF
mmetsp:Transcript_32051/g.31350  ORF Transcript_32051/g.31350 Transcript_32051/m.31350 type:complete len:203 (-) Transcript_32051:1404-2012(-)